MNKYVSIYKLLHIHSILNFAHSAHKLKGMEKTFLQHLSSSLIIVFTRVIHFNTIINHPIFESHSCKNKDNIFKTLI